MAGTNFKALVVASAIDRERRRARGHSEIDEGAIGAPES
jgi:hypothetical protein